MPINAGIYGQFAPREQSVAEYTNALNAQAMNQLAMQEGQIALAKARQGQVDDTGMRNALAALPQGATNEQRMNALRGTNSPAGYAQADALAKAAQAQELHASTMRKNDADSGEKKLKSEGERLDLATRYLSAANPNNDASIRRAYSQVVDAGLYGDDKVTAQAKADEEIRNMPAAGPSRLDWYAKQLRMGLDAKARVDSEDKAVANQTQIRGQDSTAATAKAGQQVTMRGQDSTAATARAGQQVTIRGQNMTDARVRSGGVVPGGENLGDEDVTFMARQYLKGDQSVMTNLGRGAQGANNIVRLRKAIRAEAEAAGMDPSQVALATAQFQGDKAGFRTAGTKGANIEMAAAEAGEVAVLALDASKKFNRTTFVPVNKAVRSYQSNTGDPNVVAFGAANLALINTYARAISPNGVPTVNDKQHANEMLNTAQSNEQYEAVVQQMQKEIQAALKSPGTVRANMAARMTGKSSETPESITPKTPAAGAYADPEKERRFQEYRARQGK